MLLNTFDTLWTLLPSLEFNDSSFDTWNNMRIDNVNVGDGGGDGNDEYTTANRVFFIFVRNVLVRYNCPKITRFQVNLGWSCYDDIEEDNLIHELDSWVDFALRKNVEIEFNCDALEPDEELYKIPNTVFVNNSITELKLDFLEIKHQTRFQMHLLWVLRLLHIEISGSMFHEIVQGCLILKELKISNCFSLKVLRINAPNVEKLILDTSEHYDFGPILDCPNLRSFWFTGFVNCIEVQDLSSLVNVRYNLSFQNLNSNDFEQFMAAVRPILTAKSVSFSCGYVTSQEFFYCMETHLHILKSWKHAELNMWLTEKHIPGLCCLLRSSPYLEELVIHVPCWQIDFLEPSESEHMYDENSSTSSLKKVINYNASMCSYPCLDQLICSLLKNATVLAELVIYYEVDDESSYES